MNRLKKGPELKMPELKVPDFVADLFYDLHDRRLLAPILLAVVGIAAVPFLLGGGSESPPAGSAVGIAAPNAEAEAAQAASLTVVEAKPGLRDYRKRLAGREPTNPFKQRYTAPVTGGAELDSSTSSESVASTVTTSPTSGDTSTSTTVTSAPSTAPSPEESSSGSSGGKTSGDGGGQSQLPPGSRLFGFRPDVRFGVAGSEDLTTHEELRLGSFLPRKDPILIFIGVTQNGKRALFDVSPEVSSVDGDGKCVGGEEDCRILSLQEGQAVTLLLESGQAFRLAVVRIRFVEIDVPKKASSSAAGPVASGLAQNFSN
jgi:hypothetical protein